MNEICGEKDHWRDLNERCKKVILDGEAQIVRQNMAKPVCQSVNKSTFIANFKRIVLTIIQI